VTGPAGGNRPALAGLGDALSQVVARMRAETDGGLAAIRWREDEIALAIGRHPAAENDLFHANRIVVPSIATAAWDAEFIFRGHVRELLERVAAGQDTQPATAAECCIAMAEVAMALPPHGAAAGFRLRMRQRAFPSHPDRDASLTAHYERAHGQGIDRHERYVRRRLAVPGRRLDPARIERDGEHRGRPAACKHQTAETEED
jgi:hypothetical protein